MSRSFKRDHSIDRIALAVALAFGSVQPAIFMSNPVYAETVVQNVETDVDLPKLNVTVEDKDGNELNGATVGLYSDSQAVTLLKSAKTENGVAAFDSELKINQNYYLKELKGVDGYEQDNTIHVLKITKVSPATNVLTFSYDGKTYSLNDQGSCHVNGDWGNHTVTVNIVNHKPTENTDSNGVSGDTTGNSTDSNNAQSNTQSNAQNNPRSSASDQDTGEKAFKAGGVVIGIAAAAGCIAVFTKRHKKTGGEDTHE